MKVRAVYSTVKVRRRKEISPKAHSSIGGLMKKVLLSVLLLTSILTPFLFTSCEDPSALIDETPVSAAELANTCWFFGDIELEFPETDETLYIKYLPDTLNVTKWISLKENANQTYTAKIEWSENIREIGKTSAVVITKKNGRLNVRCEFFNLTNMDSYEGITASNFDVSKVPALKADYLSNFVGTYTLNSTKYELSISAKLGISKSTTQYWNANILNAEFTDEGKYDLLLAHSSDNNGSGSIDPGITGNEPFISKQGLFWSHLVITPNGNRKFTIECSSVWTDSPYEALQTEMDMIDTFEGPESMKLHYVYNFYFGNPSKDSAGWCTVDVGEKIGTYEEELDLPTNKTWKEILEAANLSYTVPEGKMEDYWWYSTNSITSIESSYVYKLNSKYAPSLEFYNFYLSLKVKPESGTSFPITGTFKQNTTTGKSFVLTESELIYENETFSCLECKVWQSGSTYNGYACLLEKDGKTYVTYLNHYFNSKYIKFRPPKHYMGELPDAINWDIMDSQERTNYNLVE